MTNIRHPRQPQLPRHPAGSFWWRLLRAWIAAVLLSALGYAALIWAGWAYLPVTLYGTLTQLLGVPAVFQLLHRLLGLGQDAKLLAFSGVAVLWLGGLSLLGTLERPLIAGMALAILCILGLGALGWWLPIVYGLVFWALLEGVQRLLAPASNAASPAARPDQTRRTTTLGLATGGLLAAGSGLTALLSRAAAPPPRWPPCPASRCRSA